MEHVLSLGGPSPTIPGSFSAHRQQANDRISSLFFDRCHQWTQEQHWPQASKTFIFACQTPAHDKRYRKKQLTHPKILIFLPYYLRRRKNRIQHLKKKINLVSRADKKLAEMNIKKPLEPPKNGFPFLDLIRVAYEVLDDWKIFIK